MALGRLGGLAREGTGLKSRHYFGPLRHGLSRILTSSDPPQWDWLVGLNPGEKQVPHLVRDDMVLVVFGGLLARLKPCAYGETEERRAAMFLAT